MSLLPALTNPATIDNTLLTTIANNNAILTTAINDCLSRSGIQPNQMTSNLDMNSNQIVNLPPPTNLNSAARLADVVATVTANLTVPPTGTSGHVVPYLDGANTWSGTNNFSANTVLSTEYVGPSASAFGQGTAGVFGPQPNFVFYNSSDALNQKYWSIQATNGFLNLYTNNDAYTTPIPVIQAIRSGNSVSGINFPVSLVTFGSNGGSSGQIELFGSASGGALIEATSNGSIIVATPTGTTGAIVVLGTPNIQIAAWSATQWIFGGAGSISGNITLAGVTSGSANISVTATGGTLIMNTGTTIDTSGNIRTLDLYTNNANFMIRCTTPLNNAAAAATATLTNAPVAGNPTKWISFDDNGTTRRIPAW